MQDCIHNATRPVSGQEGSLFSGAATGEALICRRFVKAERTLAGVDWQQGPTIGWGAHLQPFVLLPQSSALDLAHPHGCVPGQPASAFLGRPCHKVQATGPVLDHLRHNTLMRLHDHHGPDCTHQSSKPAMPRTSIQCLLDNTQIIHLKSSALSCMLLLIIRNLLTSLAWLADNPSQQLLSFLSGLYRVDFAMPAAAC